jgi:hypothetical protein
VSVLHVLMSCFGRIVIYVFPCSLRHYRYSLNYRLFSVLLSSKAMDRYGGVFSHALGEIELTCTSTAVALCLRCVRMSQSFDVSPRVASRSFSLFQMWASGSKFFSISTPM